MASVARATVICLVFVAGIYAGENDRRAFRASRELMESLTVLNCIQKLL